jgi:hypothetical protein
VSIFGKTINCCERVSSLAEKVYDTFRIPLVDMVMIKEGGEYWLSALAPVKYSKLSKEESEMLQNLLDRRVKHHG